MLIISPAQLSAFQGKSRQHIGDRLRPSIAGLAAYRSLAEDDSAWARWWDSILASAPGVFASTPKAIAAHALFSLWFGHRYFFDPRVPWLSELLADGEGKLDYRALEVDVDDVVEIAVLKMEAVAGSEGEAHLKAVENLARFAIKLKQGTPPPWSLALAEKAMSTLYPEHFEDLSPQARQRLARSVERLMPKFAHGGKIQLPFFLSLFFFGIDPWRDPALPALHRSPGEVMSMDMEAMAECLRKQAALSAGFRLPQGASPP